MLAVDLQTCLLRLVYTSVMEKGKQITGNRHLCLFLLPIINPKIPPKLLDKCPPE